RLVYKSATIRSSLFAATDAAGIPDAIAMQLARVFATDIDFHTDLRRGDRFSVVYEMIYDSGELIAPGRILAAEFVNDGRPYEAILFTDEEGIDGYFSLDGTNRAKAFLRSPVEFSRVSSGFGARFHPIFKNWRAHTGVDFAAPKGTRVLATADGQVLSAGARGGYGNAIEIRHGSGITTLYGHLSAFAAGIRSGTRVHQGEVIGYVGMTGFATGPHLHYEFKLAGIHQDPLRVALPKADPVPARLKAQFLQVANRARTTIDLVSTASAARFE
ncbi:MAG: peptidoglycan DD-metalloendopeptidase family protein, partial [Usitatibacter sp.]